MRRHKTIIGIENNPNVLISFYPLTVKKINNIIEELYATARKNNCLKQFRSGLYEETTKTLKIAARSIPYLFVDRYQHYLTNKDIVNSAIFVPYGNATSIYSGLFEKKIMNIQKEI